MHPKMPGRVPNEGIDGQMKRDKFLRLLQKFSLQMGGNSWETGKLLLAAVIAIAIALVWEVAEATPKDGNINSSICSHQNDEEYGFEV